jgi:hypothetical protein
MQLGRAVNTVYEDQWIRCDDTALVIRGYYFPLGASKVIAYRDIRRVTPITLGPWTGKWRIWGTSHPGYWWHLDWSRPRKDTALMLDLGRPVRPVITPDNPGLVAAIIEQRHAPVS